MQIKVIHCNACGGIGAIPSDDNRHTFYTCNCCNGTGHFAIIEGLDG
jgi:DnaJ-class molecular chaperone